MNLMECICRLVQKPTFITLLAAMATHLIFFSLVEDGSFAEAGECSSHLLLVLRGHENQTEALMAIGSGSHLVHSVLLQFSDEEDTV